jgi:hypothetical protein
MLLFQVSGIRASVIAAAGVVFVVMVGVVTVASIVIVEVSVVVVVVVVIVAAGWQAGNEVVDSYVNGDHHGYGLNGINAAGQRR